MDKQTSEEMQRAEREQWKASDQFMNGEISATQLNQIEQQYVLSIKEGCHAESCVPAHFRKAIKLGLDWV